MEELFDPLITKHVEGLLTEADQQTLASRLDREPELATQLALAEALIQHKNKQNRMAASRAKLQEKLSTSAPLTIHQPRWRIQTGARAAAAAAVLLIAGYFLMREFIRPGAATGKAAFQEYYEPLAKSNLLSGGADSPEKQQWEKAINAFFNKHFTEAISAAQILTQNPLYQDKANLLIGAAYLESAEPTAAEGPLRAVRPEALKYYRKAQLYLALAQARQNKTLEALAVLQALEKDTANPDRPKLIQFKLELEKKR